MLKIYNKKHGGKYNAGQRTNKQGITRRGS